ncbi:helix-hairpin-helix domain-containing protein [Pollutibacter soli]|uniref:helix-hairpin-helix domain-containing protein n=1 Tax=Pollutibacter soli TaxID=3034157 RepID=UPI00301345DA
MWKKKILPYFQYTKKERAGILVLLGIVLLLWVIPVYLSDNSSPISKAELIIIKDSIEVDRESVSSNSHQVSAEIERAFQPNSSEEKKELKLFAFDPNHTSRGDWQRLGLTEKTISVIQHYLGKGGRFRTPDDLQKIYSIKRSDFLRLRPFIRINNFQSEPKFNSAYSNRKDNGNPSLYHTTYKKEMPDKLDVNLADQATWEKLNGIGEKLAARIVLFREKLGGFHSIEQVGETFGISPELFANLKTRLTISENFRVDKINLNSATQDELGRHPYIGRKLAALIIAFRVEHGAYENNLELQRIPLITKDVYVKIEPYLAN